jgi:hypothetical protein
MSDAARLDAIDKKLEWLRDRVDAQLNSGQYEMGFTRAHQIALHSLISMQPMTAELGEEIRRRLQEFEAHAVAEARTEAFLQGAQDAHGALSRALEARLESARTQP